MTEKIEELLEGISVGIMHLVDVLIDINSTLASHKIIQAPKKEPVAKKKPVIEKNKDTLVEDRESEGLSFAMEFAGLDPDLIEVVLDGSDTVVRAKKYWSGDDGKTRWDGFNSFLKALNFQWIKDGKKSHWRKEAHEI